MPKNNHRIKGYTPGKLEQVQLAAAFKEVGVQVPLQKYRLRYHQKVHGNWRRDPENIITKWFTDALVDFGILEDDSFENIETFEVCKPEIIPKEEEEMIIIEIEVM